MATGARLGGAAAGHNNSSSHNRYQLDLFPTATISVGRDDWADQVINNVICDDRQPEAAWTAQTRSPVAASATGQPQVEREERVRERVLEKKRLFHSQRRLELKNLPDGCTEQVMPIVGAANLRGKTLKCRVRTNQ